jgi:hypothetical protein
VRAGDVLVSPLVFSRLTGGIVNALTAHHKSQPLSAGMPREELREQLFRPRPRRAVRSRPGGPVAAGTIFVKDRVALTTHRWS